jgi:hypothetical protein
MSAHRNHAPGDVPDLPIDPPELREWEECDHQEKCENEAVCLENTRLDRDAAEERDGEARDGK